MKRQNLNIILAALAVLAMYLSLLTGEVMLGTTGVVVLVVLFLADKEFRRLF